MLGPEHPSVVESYTNLALVTCDMRADAEALQFSEKCMSIARKYYVLVPVTSWYKSCSRVWCQATGTLQRPTVIRQVGQSRLREPKVIFGLLSIGSN